MNTRSLPPTPPPVPTPTTSSTSSQPPAPASVGPGFEEALPEVHTPLSPALILERLEAASRRGKLAGWQSPATKPAPFGASFAIKDFGHPFESILLGHTAESSEGGTRLTFTTRIQPLLPAIYLVVLVASVWPGVWLTDSLIRTYFTGYTFNTYYWYMPLTVPFVPWGMWSAWKKSTRSARTDARELVERVRAALAS